MNGWTTALEHSKFSFKICLTFNLWLNLVWRDEKHSPETHKPIIEFHFMISFRISFLYFVIIFLRRGLTIGLLLLSTFLLVHTIHFDVAHIKIGTIVKPLGDNNSLSHTHRCCQSFFKRITGLFHEKLFILFQSIFVWQHVKIASKHRNTYFKSTLMFHVHHHTLGIRVIRKRKIDKILEFQPQFDWYFGAGGHANTFLSFIFSSHCFAWSRTMNKDCPFMNVTGFYVVFHTKEHHKIAAKCTLRQKNYLELQKWQRQFQGSFFLALSRSSFLFITLSCRAYVTHTCGSVYIEFQENVSMLLTSTTSN